MPSDLKCTLCDLRFSAGQYHYHGSHDGYIGRTLMVCLACGAQHAVEHAMRDRGPEAFSLLRVTIQAMPHEARSTVARRWLRQERKIGYNEALELVRALPLVLFERAQEHVVAAARAELEPLGVQLTTEIVGTVPNTNYGPVRNDRLLFVKGPLLSDARPEWLVGPDISSTQCAHVPCTQCSAHALASEVSPADPCPSCKRASLVQVAEWIT